MKRIRISLLILLSMIISGTSASVWINKKCSRFLSEISAIQELVSQGSTDEALDAATELEGDWKAFRTVASVILRSDRLSDIDRLTAGAVCRISGESSEVSAALEELRHMISSLRKSETPVFTSVF